MATPPSPTKIQPTKLRDSCNACAVSKLRCSKEKPECARCAKRGQRCEYFATRRAGRRHEPRTRHQDDGKTSNDDGSDAQSSVHVALPVSLEGVSHPTPPWDTDVHMADDTTADPSLSDTLSLDAPTLAVDDDASWRMLSAGPMSGAQDIFASFQMTNHFFIPGVGEGASKDVAELDKDEFDFGDFTGFLAPDTTTVVLDEAAFDTVEQFRLSTPWDSPASPSLASLPSSVSPSLTTTASVLTAATTIQHPPVSTTPPATRSVPTPAPPPAVAPNPPPTSNCCLLKAMELLPTLFSPSASCTCQGGLPSSHQVQPLPLTTEQVVTKNQQTLSAFQSMLTCPCTSNPTNSGYLLALISLAILQVLAWYRAAALPLAGHAPRSCHAVHATRAAPAVAGGYHLEDDNDSARMAAQLVLSELHRVQRLVTVLAQRVQVAGDGGGSGFLGAVWLGQVEGDLRRRVKGLAGEIVDLLRQ